MYRQGDVLLIPVLHVSEEMTEVPSDSRGVVLAEGETSGHFHGLVGSGKLFNFRDSAREERMLRVTSKSEVHVIGGEVGGVARHTAIRLAPGDYLVRLQRAWTSERKSQKAVD